MKRLLLLLPLLTSCASFKVVTVEHGQIVNEHNQHIELLGRPRLTCIDSNKKVIADGYFVFQTQDGSFVIDEFGSDYITVSNPMCEFNNNERLQH